MNHQPPAEQTTKTEVHSIIMCKSLLGAKVPIERKVEYGSGKKQQAKPGLPDGNNHDCNQNDHQCQKRIGCGFSGTTVSCGFL